MNDDLIKLAHGGGGKLSDQLLRETILPKLGWDHRPLADSATITTQAGRLAFTTDSYVVRPLEFPGGNIGCLAVCGTVNDLAMAGAQPLALSLGLIVEEGLPQSTLVRIVKSIADTADKIGVRIVTGDTKVVERGSADGLYINTSGIGRVLAEARLGFEHIEPDNVVIVSGTIAEHGLAVMSKRQDLAFASTLVSDVAPLAGITNSLVRQLGSAVKFLRDPTRGGLAGVLADIAQATKLGVQINEQDIPVSSAAMAAAEVLGMDVLTVANEGKFVAVISAQQADEALRICRSNQLGKAAAVIGTISHADAGQVIMTTAVGGQRIVQKPYGEELPRIC